MEPKGPPNVCTSQPMNCTKSQFNPVHPFAPQCSVISVHPPTYYYYVLPMTFTFLYLRLCQSNQWNPWGLLQVLMGSENATLNHIQTRN